MAAGLTFSNVGPAAGILRCQPVLSRTFGNVSVGIGWGYFLAKVDLARRAEIGRQKRARPRAGIIETALRVVAERGFDAPTIDDFVDAAHVARGTFYNYFQTREELLAAVAAYVVDEIDSALLPIYASTDDPARRMSVALRHFTRKSRERPEWGWLIVRMIPIEGGPLSEEMRKGVLQDLTSGKRSGRF